MEDFTVEVSKEATFYPLSGASEVFKPAERRRQAYVNATSPECAESSQYHY